MIKKFLCIIVSLFLVSSISVFAKNTTDSEKQAQTENTILLNFDIYTLDTEKNVNDFYVSEFKSNYEHTFKLINKKTGEEELFTDIIPLLQPYGNYVSRTNVHTYKIGPAKFECAIGLSLYVSNGFVQINSYSKGTISSLDRYANVQSKSASVTITPANNKLPTTKLSVSAHCVSEISTTKAKDAGINISDLVKVGYSKSSNEYYRKSDTTDYDIRVPY